MMTTKKNAKSNEFSSMRLVFFDFTTHFGGGQRSTVELLSRLMEHTDVHVLDAYGYDEPFLTAVNKASLSCHALNPKETLVNIGYRDRPLRRAWEALRALPGYMRVCLRLRKAIYKLEPDLVWTNSRKGLTALNLAVDHDKTKIGYFFRGSLRPEKINNHFRKLLRNRVNVYFVQSSLIRETIIPIGIDTNRVYIVPNAIDLTDLEAKSAQELIPPLPQSNRPIRIILPATLIPAKGHLCAIQALGMIVRNGHNAVLYFAGHIADPRQEEYKERLIEAAKREGVADRLCLIGWRDDLPCVIRSCTMVILPSHSEGMPRAVMEGMALGVPVAATPVGSTPELLLPGKTGWLFDVEDSASLADCIIEAHQSELREYIIKEAKKFICEYYNPRRQIKEMLYAIKKSVQGGEIS